MAYTKYVSLTVKVNMNVSGHLLQLPTLEHHIISGRDSNDFLLRRCILKPRYSEESPKYGMITSIYIDSEKSDVTLLHADSRLTTGHEVAEIIPLMYLPRIDI